MSLKQEYKSTDTAKETVWKNKENIIGQVGETYTKTESDERFEPKGAPTVAGTKISNGVLQAKPEADTVDFGNGVGINTMIVPSTDKADPTSAVDVKTLLDSLETVNEELEKMKKETSDLQVKRVLIKKADFDSRLWTAQDLSKKILFVFTGDVPSTTVDLTFHVESASLTNGIQLYSTERKDVVNNGDLTNCETYRVEKIGVSYKLFRQTYGLIKQSDGVEFKITNFKEIEQPWDDDRWEVYLYENAKGDG